MKDKKKIALVISIILLVFLVLLIAGACIAAIVIKKSVIGRDEACNVAYEDAGVDRTAVSYVFVEFDYDYGHFIYEVDFIANQTEYEYTIKASDGTVIKKETEGTVAATTTEAMTTETMTAEVVTTETMTTEAIITETATTETATVYDVTEAAESDSYISVDAAKAIALNAAGVIESDVTLTKTKLERDDGLMVYEVEFYQGQTEYEYTINAITGDIVEYDVDRN